MYEIRSLHLSDRDDVLEIARNTWEGHDYIPYLFDTWLEDRHSHTAAIEQEGHVVALANLRVIENGKTGWMEGLRVHPTYRGKGLATLLTQHVVKVANEIPVERIRYTTAVGNKRSLHLGEKVGMTRSSTLAIHWQDQIDEIELPASDQSLQSVTPLSIYQELVDSKIVPYNILIYDWKAVDITKENLENIGSVTESWAEMREGRINSVSFGLSRKDISGSQWSCAVYAADGPSFLSQIFHNLTIAQSSKAKSIFLTYPLKFVKTLYALDWIQPDEDEEMAITLLERVF
ncbi:MAG: GNAT family N-acetyltransferase [Promethearchaeota archaeon]